MINTALALQGFFSGFGIPAYAEDSVPDGATLPYITYQLTEPDWRETATYYANIYYRDTSYAAILFKADEIGAAIGEGHSIPTAGGAVYLSKAQRFMQLMPYEGDDTLKRVYLSMYIMAHTT